MKQQQESIEWAFIQTAETLEISLAEAERAQGVQDFWQVAQEMFKGSPPD